MGGNRRLFRFRSTFITIFVSMLLLSVALSAVSLSLLTRALLDKIEKQQTSAETTNLNTVISGVDFEFQTMHQLMTQNTSSSNIFPLSIYGEEQADLRNAAMIELNRTAVNSVRIKSIALYLKKEGQVMTSNYRFERLAESSHSNMINAYEGHEIHNFVFEGNSRLTHVFLYGPDLILAREFPLDGDTHTAALFYYLDIERLYTSLVNSLDHASLYLYDDRDIPVLSDDMQYPECDLEDVRNQLEDDGATYARVGDKVAFYGESPLVGWHFIYLTDPSRLTLSGHDLVQILFPMILLILVTAIAASYLIAGFLYKPFRELIHTVTEAHPENQMGRKRINDIEYLNLAFTDSSNREKVLTDMMQTVGEDVLTRLFGDLFKGEVISAGEVRQVLKSINSSFMISGYYEVFCLKLPKDLAEGTEDYALFRAQLGHKLEILSQQNQIIMHSILLGETMAVVVSVGDAMEDNPQKRFEELEKQIRTVLQQLLGSGLLFGAGIVYHSIFDVRFSYREAAMSIAMQEEARKKKQEAKQEKNKLNKPEDLQAREIVALVLEDKKQAACELADRVLRKIEQAAASPEECFKVMSTWKSDLASVMAETEYIQTDTLAGNKELRFDKSAMLSDDSVALREKAFSISVRMIDELDIRYQKQKNRYIAMAKKYIADNYMDQDLSQSVVADAVGTSASYLSKMFAANLEVSFSSYLSQYRVRKSCELLQATSLPVKEIAWQTGFNSVQNYIRVFRKTMGMTPGQYRSQD